MIGVNSILSSTSRPQRTLKTPVTFSGIGIHTGELVTMRFCSAEPGTGIVFKRIDLQDHPIIPATIEYVCDTSRNNTTIGIHSIRIFTIEHVMAALAANKIDNLCIEIDNIEPPVGNGSSDVFVDMIEKAGIVEQDGIVPIVKVLKPIFFSENEIHLVALPDDQYRISYTLHYPESPALRGQFQSFSIDNKSFKQELAPCRTFSRYEEVASLMDRGLIKGGSLNNAVIIHQEAVYSKGGLFFPDEMVRHKILDMVGDLALLGFDFHAHIIAIRSGHATNFAFAKKLYHYITTENS
jgi:UDP-3-O-[3-hydroxymyristoyl] N-acetylglucosamine deacetylase